MYTRETDVYDCCSHISHMSSVFLRQHVKLKDFQQLQATPLNQSEDVLIVAVSRYTDLFSIFLNDYHNLFLKRIQ